MESTNTNKQAETQVTTTQTNAIIENARGVILNGFDGFNLSKQSNAKPSILLLVGENAIKKGKVSLSNNVLEERILKNTYTIGNETINFPKYTTLQRLINEVKAHAFNNDVTPSQIMIITPSGLILKGRDILNPLYIVRALFSKFYLNNRNENELLINETLSNISNFVKEKIEIPTFIGETSTVGLKNKDFALHLFRLGFRGLYDDSNHMVRLDLEKFNELQKVINL